MGPVRSHDIREIHVSGDSPNPMLSFIDLWLEWTNPLSFHWANKLTLDNVSESFRRWAVTSFLWGRLGEGIWFRRVNAGSEQKYLRSAAEQMRTGKKKNSWHFQRRSASEEQRKSIHARTKKFTDSMSQRKETESYARWWRSITPTVSLQLMMAKTHTVYTAIHLLWELKKHKRLHWI